MSISTKIRIFFSQFLRPIEDNFIMWQEVIFNNAEPHIFWDDLSFFQLNEDENFFDWYNFESITYWRFLKDE